MNLVFNFKLTFLLKEENGIAVSGRSNLLISIINQAFIRTSKSQISESQLYYYINFQTSY